jgi:hypothetical protein
MNTQKIEIGKPQITEARPHELTTIELDGVSGGIRNNQTEWWAAFQNGMDIGQIMAGGRPICVDVVF